VSVKFDHILAVIASAGKAIKAKFNFSAPIKKGYAKVSMERGWVGEYGPDFLMSHPNFGIVICID